ncbi:class I SAM-dependent methyltransferase [Candidatus Nitrosotenuis uzonensis]|uniref:Methyltransferase domain-containing protein n=1 Tax=Candidatus Nitrosotenuis uzonensis TaxID=1407055 RepID=V6AVD3_9ARCH|nr:class I SAM-dependent methyltransferase [Candidatus Nitrosotenuis uzonensis]CDI06458.1 conserved hypothetical protein [Candidatus Nitrosotenuis uzonensis]
MKEQTHNEILKHYTELYEKYGVNPASLGWPKGRQNIRFKIITEVGNLSNSKILDIGCGFGDLYSFIKKKRIKTKYTGIDINKKFIEVAKQKHPLTRFFVRDIEERKFREKFDWVFAVGTTNKAGSYRYVEDLLTEMFRIAKKGIAMDFMSTYVDFRRKGSSHFSPERIFKIGKKLSKRVVIRHDYLPFEFCVYVYKQEQLTKNQTYVDF